MKTLYYTASSLDGYIAAPGNDLDWLMQFGEPEGGGSYAAFIRDVGAIAMGSATYEWVLRELVRAGGEGSANDGEEEKQAGKGAGSREEKAPDPFSGLPMPGEPQPWPYAQPTWVFTSRDLPVVPGADIRFVRGDVRPVHRAMVEAIGGADSVKNIWIAGGGDLVGQFWDAGLLDELIVQVASVTLGRGAPLLPRAIVTPPLRLTSAERWGEAFVELRYEVTPPARG